jgi:galactokinase
MGQTPDAQTLFKRHFAYPATHLVYAPGHLELLGSAAVDPDGLALTAAIDQNVEIASAPRSDGKIELASSFSPERDLFWMSDLGPNGKTPWADCMRAVFVELRRRGVHFSGFNAAVFQQGGELSSWAALQVATALTVRRLYPFGLSETGATILPKRNARGQLPPPSAAEKIALAKLCQAAAQKQAGGNPALSGPISSLFGKAWHLLSIDQRFLTVEPVPLIGEVFIRCEPLSDAEEKNGADTDPEIRSCCETAAQKLGAKSFRSLELKFLEANKAKLEAREYECARHFVGDVHRLVAAERALRADDHRQFGQYLTDSYRSARELLNTGSADLDLLLEIAKEQPGWLGSVARGSAIFNLVGFHQAEGFKTATTEEFKARTGRGLRTTLVRTAGGAAG